MPPVASKCCRSTPRCLNCPVLLARRRRTVSATQDLISEVLLGTAARDLPPAVTRELELLADARRRAAPALPSL